jgi:hypothetical protein
MHGLPYEFDPYQLRYQSSWPSPRTDAIVKSDYAIWIYVNEDASFKKAVVEEVFTYT